MYICDSGIDISIIHVCILMQELCFEFEKVISLQQERYEKNFKSHQ